MPGAAVAVIVSDHPHGTGRELLKQHELDLLEMQVKFILWFHSLRCKPPLAVLPVPKATIRFVAVELTRGNIFRNRYDNALKPAM